MEPVVVAARQAAVLDPIDADEVIELLEHAAVLVGHLAAEPGAESLNVELTGGDRPLTELAIDLALTAAELTDATYPDV